MGLALAKPFQAAEIHDSLYLRRYRVAELVIRAMVSGAWALEDLFLGYKSQFIIVRIASTVMILVCALMLAMVSSSSRRAEAIFALCILVWNTSIVWGFTFQERIIGIDTIWLTQDTAVIFLMDMLSQGLGPRLKKLCIAFHVVNCAGFLWTRGTISCPTYGTDGLVTLVLMLLVVAHAVFRRQELYNRLSAEQMATMSLVRMISDAGFWVAADGDTISRGDPHLDAIIGTPMEGTRLTDHLAEPDRRRFRVATMGTPGSVKLLPVAIQRADAAAFEAELFIVATSDQNQECCFLIGLRLSQAPDEKFESANEEAAMAMQAIRSRALSDALAICADSRFPSYKPATDAGSVSDGATLASDVLEPLRVQPIRRELVVDTLMSGRGRDQQLQETLRTALALCCDHAAGGALVLIAHTRAFAAVFGNNDFDVVPSCSPSPSPSGCNHHAPAASAPALKSSDSGYMSERLRGIHVGDARFIAAFREFTEKTLSDRWPADHPDVAARGMPKDGAFLLSSTGFRLKCAAKVLGLTPPKLWRGVGTKHEAALACAWAIPGCIALVRSDTGTVHGIIRGGSTLTAYIVQVAQEQV